MIDRLNKLKFQLDRFANFDFRPGQVDALKFILESQRPIKVLTAPTGSGKSLTGIIAGMDHSRFLYLCSSKQLQSQLEKEFPECKVMWGRNNFPCTAFTDLTASECPHRTINLQTASPLIRDMVKLCKSKCPYEIRKQEVLNHKYQILNYSYFLFEGNFIGRFSDYPIIICDEADTIEGILSNFILLRISKRQLDLLEIKPPKRKTSTAKDSMDVWKTWAEKIENKVTARKSLILGRLDDMTPDNFGFQGLSREVEMLKNFIFKLDVFIESMDDTWLFDEVTDFRGKIQAYEFKPTWLSPALVQKFFLRHADSFVFMSATFPPAHILAKILGLHVGDIDHLEIASSFPVENRTVYLDPVGDLSFKTFDQDIPKILDRLRRILVDHKNEKGIIHTVSWKLNKAIMGMESTQKHRLITHDASNKFEILEKFIESKEPLVFVSPSSTRGIDLPDELCRFCVIAKMPYQSLGDKLVKSRVYGSSIGNVWYSSDAAQEVVQATGRGVRSKTDWCITYILDKQAVKRITSDYRQKLFPVYWKEALDV